MEGLWLEKDVRRVTVLTRDATTGDLIPVVIFERKRKKRKRRKPPNWLEQAVRLLVEAQSTLAQEYLSRQDRRNQKDGWIHDVAGSVISAAEQGSRRLKSDRALCS